MKSSLLTGLIALGLISAPLRADNPSPLDTDRAAVQAQKKAIINRAMNLDDSTGKIFWPLYDQYQAARANVTTKGIALIQDYAKNYQTMTDAKAMELLNGMVQAQDEKNKVRADYIKKFSAVLPGRVVARFFQADNKLDAFANASAAQQIPLVPTADLPSLSMNAPAAQNPK